MKSAAFFITLLAISPLNGQPLSQQRIVYPTVSSNPNASRPNPNYPPAPNPINPYDPYDTRTSQAGMAFTEANSEAMHFLNIVDNQIYSGAWRDAGRIMQDIVPQAVWVEGMRALRNPLGPVRARKVTDHRRVRTLPGGLSGEMMILTFETEFAFQALAVETVTLMMHPPVGRWRVISYNLSP